jgi:hypothetical protein
MRFTVGDAALPEGQKQGTPPLCPYACGLDGSSSHNENLIFVVPLRPWDGYWTKPHGAALWHAQQAPTYGARWREMAQVEDGSKAVGGNTPL